MKRKDRKQKDLLTVNITLHSVKNKLYLYLYSYQLRVLCAPTWHPCLNKALPSQDPAHAAVICSNGSSASWILEIIAQNYADSLFHSATGQGAPQGREHRHDGWMSSPPSLWGSPTGWAGDDWAKGTVVLGGPLPSRTELLVAAQNRKKEKGMTGFVGSNG